MLDHSVPFQSLTLVGCSRVESFSEHVYEALLSLSLETVPIVITRNDSLTDSLDSKKNLLPNKLRESYEAFWSAFGGQIRTTRNDAGHPTSVDPVTPDAAHSLLLIFPEFAKLSYELKSRISTSYS